MEAMKLNSYQPGHWHRAIRLQIPAAPSPLHQYLAQGRQPDLAGLHLSHLEYGDDSVGPHLTGLMG